MSLGFLQDEKREHRRDSGDHRGVKGEEDVRHRRVGDRERAERDEHRERAPRAEVELGRNRRRETTKESEKSHRPEAKAEVSVVRADFPHCGTNTGNLLFSSRPLKWTFSILSLRSFRMQHQSVTQWKRKQQESQRRL